VGDVSDPFDIENLRLSPELAAELAKAKAERDASKRKGNKPEWLAGKIAASSAGTKKPRKAEDWYVRVSLRALAVASGALRERRLVVFLYILYRVFKDKRHTVAVGNEILARLGVSARTKTRALKDYEQAGVLSVEWRSGKSPLVTVPGRYVVKSPLDAYPVRSDDDPDSSD
jgi:hypothetical protein